MTGREPGSGQWMFRTDGNGDAHRPNVQCATFCQPVVVIDPEDREQVERLVGLIRDGRDDAGGRGLSWNRATTEALRSLVEPPKPPEPTGLGAVVETHAGDLYIRHGNGPAAWMLAGASPNNRDTYPWRQINAARVLSEGVTP